MYDEPPKWDTKHMHLRESNLFVQSYIKMELVSALLTHVRPLFPYSICSQWILSLSPENSKVFWYFQGLPKGRIGNIWVIMSRSSVLKVFLGKGIAKIWSKFTGEHQCRSVISVKLFCDFIETIFWHGCFPVNLFVFRIPFPQITSRQLVLKLNQC